MHRILIMCGILFLLTACNETTNTKSKSNSDDSRPDYAMVIHGGAGYITKNNIDEESALKHKSYLDTALTIGQQVLKDGGSALTAVEKTINYMENIPIFNAGKGAVFTHNGRNSLDASIMEGTHKKAGSVAGVSQVKHPISAARAVMEKSNHVLLSGQGADEFAKGVGLEMVDTSYFYTKRSWDALQNVLESEKKSGNIDEEYPDYKFGTVGAVALDNQGHLAAGTSTGGMTNKRWDRIGDSPIIGAGTYADDQTCGVSCTGHGEYFIRYAVAHDVSAQMAYGNKSVQEASDQIINETLENINAKGGLIALDKNGNIAMPFNTPGMYRGVVTEKGKWTALFKDELYPE